MNICRKPDRLMQYNYLVCFGARLDFHGSKNSFVRETKPLVLCLKQYHLKPISVVGSLHMRINNSIRTTILPVTIQLLNFLPGLRMIMRICNDPESFILKILISRRGLLKHSD